MKPKNKRIEHKKITIKNIICFSIFAIISINLIIIFKTYFLKNNVYAKETSVNIQKAKISNAQKIDIEEILKQNVKQGKKEEYTTQEVELEYITKYRTNEELPKGIIQVIQEGREGKQILTIKKTYENNELISEEQISSKVTKAAINKIVEIGGGKTKSNYKVKVGDIVYVTSDRLSVMFEPNEKSQKIATLTKGIELTVQEIKNEWYKIKSGSTIGYVKSECTTYINNNYQEESTTESQSKAQLSSKLSFDMQLNKPSGLSLEQFKKVLSDNKDTNKIFINNAQYFYYIEKQYNINGIFVAAIGIHESAWGTSKIAKDKNNLFGYGAYDSNPYNGAYSFSDYSESIDLISRVLVKYYLNPKGTSIYGGEQAQGTYYNGATLTGVNKKYATDTNWANAVYKNMKYLYNKL